MALEQQLGERASARGGALGERAGEQRRGQRPAARGWASARPARRRAEKRPAGARRGARQPGGPPPVAARGARAGREREPRRAQRRESVIGGLPRPDEIPQRLLDYLRGLRDVGEQIGEEARALRESRAHALARGGLAIVTYTLALRHAGRVVASRTAVARSPRRGGGPSRATSSRK